MIASLGKALNFRQEMNPHVVMATGVLLTQFPGVRLFSRLNGGKTSCERSI